MAATKQDSETRKILKFYDKVVTLCWQLAKEKMVVTYSHLRVGRYPSLRMGFELPRGISTNISLDYFHSEKPSHLLVANFNTRLSELVVLSTGHKATPESCVKSIREYLLAQIDKYK